MKIVKENYTKEIKLQNNSYKIIDLSKLVRDFPQISRLPYSIRILLENAIRNLDGFLVKAEHVERLINWKPETENTTIPFMPARVLMQDFTGVPSVVDIAAIRSEIARRGKDPMTINPKIPVDLVIDHSVQVDFHGSHDAYRKNVDYEYKRNGERYKLLKWAQNAFNNFTVVPPGMGICHQVNLEYLAKGIVSRAGWAFPDTLVGTDSHTPMVNGIGVLGWGVGGIEAEAALLGQALYFNCPKVIGLELIGKLPQGITATDMVLEITKQLRNYGVVGDFVEVFGKGLDHLSVPDRATIANMSPEFGCTVTYFPIDDQTIRYMKATKRNEETLSLTETYCKQNLLWRTVKEDINYSDILTIDLSKLEPAVSGPKRPQDKILTKDLKKNFNSILSEIKIKGSKTSNKDIQVDTSNVAVDKQTFDLDDGAIVLAAITSCTNTSNPAVMLGAGLLAKKAVEQGLEIKPWVKTSLAPGSKVVTNYLKRADLLKELEALNFHIVGYGCTTCIGNSGPLPIPISELIKNKKIAVASVLSGNRNFEARIHSEIDMNFLTSPMLVIAYAIAGTINIDLTNDPLATDPLGQNIFLKDIWPTQEEINEAMEKATTVDDYENVYKIIFDGDEQWQNLDVPSGTNYKWDEESTYIKEIPFFKNISDMPEPLKPVENARVLLKLGDSVTTDHISPAGSFSTDSPAGQYMNLKNIPTNLFNSYGSRRGNHEVMMRGTFANVRINNSLASKQGGYTTYSPENAEMTVYDAAMKYKENNTPLIVIAGEAYGSGSSRDWAAKGTNLLGIKAVIAVSYERIHRSNLAGMGVLPLEFKEGENAETIGLSGKEIYTISGIEKGLIPGQIMKVKAVKSDEKEICFDVILRLDSDIEIEYMKHGGILQYILRQYLKNHK